MVLNIFLAVLSSLPAIYPVYSVSEQTFFSLACYSWICSMLIFQSHELFHYMLCQLTYNFDYVLMLSVPPFHFPYYLLEHAHISKSTLHFPSVPCLTLLSLPTFPSRGLGFFPGHHVLPGCPDITSAVRHTVTTPIQAISSQKYSVNWLCLIVLSTHWRVWERKWSWGMSQRV